MATGRSTRVTQVDPWIAGGEGQLRDLFPLPPPVFLAIRLLNFLFIKHFLLTPLFLFCIYLWWLNDWGWFPAFIVLPLLLILIRQAVRISWLWYRNPAVPLLARKN